MHFRQDIADIRRTELSHNIGLASYDRYNLVKSKLSKTKKLIDFITKLSVLPSEMNPILENKNSKPISQSMKLKKLYCRPNIVSEDVLKIKALNDFINENSIEEEIVEQSEIQIKYSGYIDKEKSHAEKLNNLESVKIPLAFDYSKLKSLASEAKSKLEERRIIPSRVEAYKYKRKVGKTSVYRDIMQDIKTELKSEDDEEDKKD